jgi:hypothetical protein
MPPYPDYPAWQGIPGAGQGIQCFPFAAGWLVRSGNSGGVIYVPDPDQIGGVGAGTTAILAAIANLSEKVDIMSGTLQTSIDAMTAEVARQTTVNASALALINGFSARLQAAIDAATAAGATPTQTAALSALQSTLTTNDDALAAAVAANTPAAGP